MAAPDTITCAQLTRLIGTPDAPVIIDVRIPQDIEADPRFVPGTIFRSHKNVADWAGDFADRDVAVVCHRGLKLSHGVAAWLRHAAAHSGLLVV